MGEDEICNFEMHNNPNFEQTYTQNSHREFDDDEIIQVQTGYDN